MIFGYYVVPIRILFIRIFLRFLVEDLRRAFPFLRPQKKNSTDITKPCP